MGIVKIKYIKYRLKKPGRVIQHFVSWLFYKANYLRTHLKLVCTAACICLQQFFSLPLSAQKTDTSFFQSSRTFVNISKPSGGVFEPGDMVEVRYTINVQQGSSSVSGGSGAKWYYNWLKGAEIKDTIPSYVSYNSNSLKILTNEGLLYQGAFTDAADGDQGSYTSSGGYNIVSIKARPNTGTTLDTLNGGEWRYNGSWSFQSGTVTKPKFSKGALLMLTYRVTVTGSYGQFITFDKSNLWFKSSTDAAVVPKYQYPRSVVAIYQSPGLCSNGLSLSNVFETNGTFGSGKSRNRGSSSSIVPTGSAGYTFIAATTNQPNDGYYAIVNNTSEGGSSDTTYNGTFFSPKIFDKFDIFGDHTGSVNTATGNAPVDTASAKPGGGYMLMVNASYATNAAVSQTVDNLCTNTYYEFSAWFRNICPRCASDSLGNSNNTGTSPNPSYVTYPGNDSAGVRPNLAFEINDTTYYVTGDLAYDKTQINPWKQRGFVFLNNLSSFKITIRNNSPGGGGNDWVMDDVNVSACVPTLTMNYAPIFLGCGTGVQADLAGTVRYAYNAGFIHYRWEKSTNGGSSWSSTGVTGTGTPSLVSGQWQFTTNYPSFTAYAADSGTMYRVVVATSATNLVGSTCSFTDGNITLLKIIDCTNILDVDLLSLNGKLVDNNAFLQWNVAGERNFDRYEIEKSYDGVHFIKIGEAKGKNLMQPMNYDFADPEGLNDYSCYRLKLIDARGLYKYSKVILLSRQLHFEVRNVKNPFSTTMNAQVILPADGIVGISLFDSYGRRITTQKQKLFKGLNGVSLAGLNNLSNGIYFVSFELNNETLQRKLVRLK